MILQVPFLVMKFNRREQFRSIVNGKFIRYIECVFSAEHRFEDFSKREGNKQNGLHHVDDSKQYTNGIHIKPGQKTCSK